MLIRRSRQPGALRQQAADTAGQTDRRLDQPTNAEKPRLRCQPARLKSSKRLVQPPFGLVLCDRSPHQTLTCVSWTGLRCLPERTPLGTPTVTGCGIQSVRIRTSEARNSSPPHYDTDPKPAVPSLNDEPGCIKVVDTFRYARGANETLRAVLFPANEPSQRYPMERSWGTAQASPCSPTKYLDDLGYCWQAPAQAGVIDRGSFNHASPALCRSATFDWWLRAL